MRSAACEAGQALPVAVAIAGALLALAFALLQLGLAHLAVAQAQTAADAAALAAARELSSRGGAGGRSAEAVAAEVARGSGAQLRRLGLPAPRGGALGEVEVVVVHRGPLGVVVEARARAGWAASARRRTARARGGGYEGPLVYRDGRPVCPAVAAAFDRMDVAARRSGVDLVVTSGYRSDAEQAELFRRRPDPRWVAPPGRSRHRDATELDISGAGGAWSWLARHAGRFGFVQRYSWEPWHWGFIDGCGSPASTGEGLRPGAAKPSGVLLG